MQAESNVNVVWTTLTDLPLNGLIIRHLIQSVRHNITANSFLALHNVNGEHRELQLFLF